MADGSAALNDWVGKLHDLGKLAETSAPAVAVAVKHELDGQVARSVGPDGRAWKRTKEGKRPLANAADAISVRAIGDVVLVRLKGHHARHHLGAVKGGVKREIIPTGKIPDPVTKAIRKTVEQQFRKTMGTR